MTLFTRELSERLGPRRMRLLLSAWARDLWHDALLTAEKNGVSVAHLGSAASEALDAVDRFADTGKSKTALKEAHKRLQGLAFDDRCPISEVRMLTASLVSQDLDKTLAVAANVGNLLTLGGKSTLGSLLSLVKTPRVEDAMPRFREYTDDLTAPAGNAARIDPACCTPEVLDLAQAIYQERRFARMAELADALQRAGCANQHVLDHCGADAVHIRGCWVLDGVLGELISKPKAATRRPRDVKRHQILGRELHETRELTLQAVARDEAKYRERTQPGRPEQQFSRELYLDSCVRCAVLEHLGYGPLDDLPARLNRGVDAALDYFFGDWWHADERDAIALDKSRPDRELCWAGALAHGLLLAGLTGRWEDAARLCSWIDGQIQLEHRFEMNDYEYQWLYLCIASELRGEPLQGGEEMLTALQECRPKRPRLLAAAWQAALAGDQKSFDKALTQSVRHFLKSQADDAPNVNFWVARDESLLGLLAEHCGLRFPAMPEKPAAAVLRRQTTGWPGS